MLSCKKEPIAFLAVDPLYADIILPLARNAFTFRVGDNIREDIAEGRCVEVQLGRRKHYIGVVWKLHGEEPGYANIKEVDSLIADAPALSKNLMSFWEWIADYYMCTLGEVMRAAFPSALKPQGFSHEQFFRKTYKASKVQYVALHPDVADRDALNAVFEKLRRTKRQYAALINLVSLLGDDNLFSGEVPRPALDADAVVINALVKKGILRTAIREPRQGELPPLPEFLPALTPVQKVAFNSIKARFADRNVVLLQGVTGSGKTEIYINLINEQLRAGRNVLYLMPEIAMTAQLIERIEVWFGERVIAYHSKFTDRSRVGSYLRINSSRGGELVLGARSALFLPVGNLGLVIVDEEHDGSYKQSETAPRYNARDSAIVLARMTGAKILLGSATPSIESRVNASEGKYGLVMLGERFGDTPLPRMIISDTVMAVKRGERTKHFNKVLIDKIASTLAVGRQVMLFQNRRGFSPYVECAECGRVEVCPQCNVTMTYHKAGNSLKCHYCGHTEAPSATCKGCGSPAMRTMGFGTEKVEEELALLFPRARIGRLDRDTVQTPKLYKRVISSFEKGDTDILVGTQMITKGFDFGGVALVGILNADNLLNYPDFRAAERAFQLMIQVAGRAGRRIEQGEVVLQTSQPDNPLIRQIASYDYDGMVRTQLAERRDFFYPPYCRMVGITMKHKDNKLLWDAANVFAADLRRIFGKRILGPQPPPVDRIKGEYLLSLLLKIERTKSFSEAKTLLSGAAAKLRAEKRFGPIDVIFNVDPQ